ncbi:MAG: hypothetical protein KBB55_02190 [Candidatus Buchananbacteria bacterium]|nr:hypothetical protein [Candidatus Buchananbacteria bacterium]
MESCLESLLNINIEHAKKFTDPAATLERRRYRYEHPTEIAALKCMDGRLHLPVMTQTPAGIIQPWRNIGGKFDLGWYGFQASMASWVEYAIRNGKRCLVLTTYHYARGDHHRGCKGFGYDTDAAKASAFKLKAQFERVFGSGVVHTIAVGIETDLEALILHGEKGQVVDLAEQTFVDADSLKRLLQELYPSMDPQIRRDFLPLVEGNIRHIAEVRASNRLTVETEHREWVLGIGRGFDWLHKINTALLVGPFDPNVAPSIAVAAKLLLGNIQEGRVSGKIVLMSSALYPRSSGYEPALAKEKALFYLNFASEIIEREVPELLTHLEKVAIRVDINTHKAEVVS